MKIRILLLMLFFIELFTVSIYAVQAYPLPVKYKQADGTTVTILIKGDEFLNWKETTDGYTLLHNSEGELEYAILDKESNLVPSGVVARDVEKRDFKQIALLAKTPKKLFYNKTQINVSKQLRAIRDAEMVKMQKAPGSTVTTESANSINAFPTTGPRNLICILMGFSDKAFTLTQSDFYNLFNQINYTVDGATGSVKEYYLENSYNLFNLTVDVAGPYTAANPLAYYGNNTNGNPGALITEAVTFADPTVDYRNYDNDNNGEVDGVYVIFAGFGEEAGGGSNPDAIWSHASSINYIANEGTPGIPINVSVKKYSCSPEYRGNSGTGITRIGVICHEFGHVLGSPDYYDTNYNEIGDGEFSGTGSWDMMAGGTWNNSGATPAHHNGWTKVMYYNWADVSTLNSPQSITLYNAEENTNSFYRINTSTEGEYFFIENREKHKFDSYIPGSGMLIYHVHSGVFNVGNEINVTHPQRMYPVAQNATQDPTGLGTYGTINSSTCAWTGTGKTSFTDSSTPSSKSWSGANSYKPITGISRDAIAKTVGFSFMGYGNSCTLPTNQATNLTFSDVQDNQITVNWTRGNGDRVIVLARRNSAVNATPLNGTAFNANSAFQQGDLVDPNTYVIYDGTGTNVTFTDLLKISTYYFAVFEYNSAGHCYLTPALSGSVATTGCTSCVPSSSPYSGMGITNVKFNAINNSSSSSSGYTNFSELITEVTAGQTYNLEITLDTWGYTMFTKAWIDWNNDCIYQLSEEYDLGSSASSPDIKAITIPINAISGYVTMRVRSSYNTSPTSCNAMNYSDTEDYTLKVTGGCTPPTIQASNFSASNIQSEQMTINWTRGNGNKVLVIARQGSAVDSYLIGATDLTANAEFGSGTQIGAGNYVVYNGTNNNVTVTGLIPGTTYYFAVYEFNSPNNCILQPALAGNYTTTSCSFCAATSTTNFGYGITNVSFNTINKSSSVTPYSDFSSIFTNVTVGNSYNLSVTTNSGIYEAYIKAWIDWDKDCSIQTNEIYDLGYGTNNPLTLTLSILIPSDAKDGYVKMRVRSRLLNAPDHCGDNDYSEAEDYSLRVVRANTSWDGSSWSVASPTSLYNVIIDGTYNDAGFTCNNLTINSGKQVTIASGTLTVNGNILLQSDETNGTATLVNNGTVNKTIKGTVQQYLATTRNWYISSPISNATLPLGYSGFLYRESGDNSGFTSPATAYWKSVAPGDALTTGTGYIALPANDGLTFSFSTGSTGHINDGDITIPVTRTAGKTKEGYNLVGNPYPSYLNWMSVIDAANTGTTNMSTTMWYRTKNNATTSVFVFDTYNETANTGTNNNGLGAVTGMIPPMQAFWVRVAAGNNDGTLALNNTMRSHQDIITNKFRLPSANNTTQQVLRLKVSDGENSDEAILLFNPNASNGIDNYDSPKMMNDNASTISEIYTKVGTEKLVINGMNSIPYNIEIPLYFNVNASTASTFTIKAAELNNFEEGTPIYVKNNLTGEQQLISDGSSYTFEPAEGINNDPAFSVIIKAPGSITDITNRETDGIFLYGNANKQIVVSVKNLSGDNSSLSVYNTVGQKIASSTITTNKTLIEVPVSGVYMVAVNNGGKITNFKVIVK